MKVKLLKKVRSMFFIIPNIDYRYGFYIISKKNGLVYDNQPYGGRFCVDILVQKTFGFLRAYLIKRIHEQNKVERKSDTILKRLQKQHKWGFVFVEWYKLSTQYEIVALRG